MPRFSKNETRFAFAKTFPIFAAKNEKQETKFDDNE